ncbi:condensation domain-containing protein [Kitasatospora sp. NPDC088351]|uniref:condensation domain-containing protein n=1 Tax=Kitasatospora sp. NPDC088351 TaxID=3155180 RepID=UPI00342BA071
MTGMAEPPKDLVRTPPADFPAADSPAAGPVDPADPADILLAVFKEHLAVEQIDRDSRFYALGGDSLIAVRVVNAARARGIPVSLRNLMVHQTVRGVIGSPAVVEALAAGGGADRSTAAETAFSLLDPADRSLVPAGVVDALPASALQVGMLYLCETSQDPLLYHIMHGWEVCAPFDESCFRTALAELGRRHPALRTSFDLGELSEPAQLVWERAEPALSVDRAADAGKAEALVRDWRDRRADTPLDWQSPPLFHCQVVALPASFHVALAAHHAILDGWSFSRLAVELMTLYHLGLGGQGVELPGLAPDVQRDFIAAERATAGSAAAADHWFGQANVPALLFGAAASGRVPDPRERCETALAPELVGALSAVARMLGVPVKSVALAAHARALGSWTGREHDVVTGVVFNTRPESAGSDLAAGLFLNTLPIRFTTVDDTWTGLIRAAATAERESAPYQAYPQARVVERLGRPAFDVTFNFMNFHAYQELDRLASLPTRGWWRRGKPSFPFHVNVEITGTDGQIRIGFDPAFVPRTAAEAYADLLRQSLSALVANPVSPAAPPGPPRPSAPSAPSAPPAPNDRGI